MTIEKAGKNIFLITLVIAFIGVMGAIVYGLWNLERTINYNMSYKSMVEQTVREMVKPEALKDSTKGK